MTGRFIRALIAFVILAAMAGWTLGDAAVRIGGRTVELRVAVWLVLGAFALKTLIAYGRFRSEESNDHSSHSSHRHD